MKTKIHFFCITVFILLVFCSSVIHSQIQNSFVCGMTEEIMNNLSTNYYPVFPMNDDTLKCLVIFCNYPYPDGNYDPGIALLQYWPGTKAQDMPDWAHNIIASNTINIPDPSLTGIFKVSSMGKFYLIGDVYPNLYVFEHNAEYYSAPGRNMGFAIREMLENLDPYIDYSQYDKYDPEDIDADGNRREPDGIVDMIFVPMRFTLSSIVDGYSYQGIACLGGMSGTFGEGVTEITLDGKRILAGAMKSGCIAELYNPWSIGVFVHEFGLHYGFGPHVNGMGVFNINGWGLASAADREQFGWNLNPSFTPNVNSTITLRDYFSTNDNIKINRSSDIIYIENRQRKNYYSGNEYICWKWTENEPLRPHQPDSLIVIYRKLSYVSYNIQSANGKWIWQKCLDPYYKVNYTSPTLNYFYPDYPDRFNGLSTFSLNYVSAYDNSCSNFLGSQICYMGGGGDSNTCFDINYNDVYSPWSNPPLPVENPGDSLCIELAEKIVLVI